MVKKERMGFLWLLLCIPIPIIIYLGIMYSQNEISPDEIKSVTVTDTTGLQGKYIDDGSIEFFVNLLLNSEKVDGAWRDFGDETPVELAFERNNGSVFRHYVYAELDTTGCFVLDKDGNVKRVAEKDAKELLLRNEWQYLYEPLRLPKLSVVKSGTNDAADSGIPPVEYSWQYKKTNGEFGADTETKLISAGRKPVYINAENKYEFAFSRVPDLLDVVLRNGDMILPDNSLSSLIFSTDTEITADITATWNNGDGKECYGNAKWSFKIIYDISPTASMDVSELFPGEVGVVKFVNLSEGETVKMETELKTSELRTIKGDGCKLVFIPIAADNNAGDYSLKFTIGSNTYDFTIKVKSKQFDTVRSTVGVEVYNEAFKPDNTAAFSNMVSELTANSIDGALYDESAFSDPVGSIDPSQAVTPGIKYGSAVIYNNSDPPYVTYRGTDYLADEGTVVKASQRGKVVFNGETAETGKTVIIDHGNGILSYYFHLSSAMAGVDKVVQKGEIIANSGKTGLTDQSKLCFAVSVNGVFVDPAFLLANGAPK